MAGIGPPAAAPTPGCTPSSPHIQPAPLTTLPGLTCEWESVNVVQERYSGGGHHGVTRG